MALSRQSKARKSVHQPIDPDRGSMSVEEPVAQVLAEMQRICLDPGVQSERQQLFQDMRRTLRANLVRGGRRTKRASNGDKSVRVGVYVFLDDGTPAESD